MGLIFKFRWHEPWLSPGVHALRAAGGNVTLTANKSVWLRAIAGEDFLATADSLSLRNSRLSDEEVAALLKPFEDVQWLDLAEMQLGPATNSELTRFTKLHAANFADMPVSDAMLRSLVGSTSLQSVWLRGARIEGHALAGLASLTMLRHVGLDRSNFDSEQLADLGICTRLTSVSLSRCANVTDEALPRSRSLSG